MLGIPCRPASLTLYQKEREEVKKTGNSCTF